MFEIMCDAISLTKKQPEPGMCFSNTFRSYRSSLLTRMLKCDFALRHGCSHVSLLHIFRTPFPKNTSEGLKFIDFPGFFGKQIF